MLQGDEKSDTNVTPMERRSSLGLEGPRDYHQRGFVGVDKVGEVGLQVGLRVGLKVGLKVEAS